METKLFDLLNVTPAPWFYEERIGIAGVYSQKPPDCLMEEVKGLRCIASKQGVFGGTGWIMDKTDCADMAFIALARNAFDVMMRRKWNPIEQEEAWIVVDEHGDAIYRFKARGGDGSMIQAADPFTALVEADAWYKANVEGKQ